MLSAGPTNVKQPPKIFSPPSCNKPKSLSSQHHASRSHPRRSKLTVLSTRRHCQELTDSLFGTTTYGMHFEPKTVTRSHLCVPDRSQMVTWPLLSVHSGPTVCCCEHVYNDINTITGMLQFEKKQYYFATSIWFYSVYQSYITSNF